MGTPDSSGSPAISQPAGRRRLHGVMTLVTSLVHTRLASPIGDLVATADGRGALTGLYFPGHLRGPVGEALGDRRDDAEPFAALRAQLAEYFAGERRGFELPLAPVGDDFRQRVWALLRQIPYGERTTYGALAARLGQPGAAQAVGAANGANPISIIVPCHRVVGADGSLTGYAGGLDRKRWLLAHEEGAPTEAGRLF